MTKANQDIRDYMADHSVSQRMMAEAMGVSQFTINKRLQTELSQKDKEMWLNIIDTFKPNASKVISKEDGLDEVDEIEEAEQSEEAVDVSVSTKFQIGDRVKVPSKNDKIGTGSDIWHSLSQSRLMYAVTMENESHCCLYAEDQLEFAPLPTEYRFESVIDGNVAITTMIATQGDKTWVYARGHAHILHDGEVGMAQAISYSARRMFESLDKKQENKIYFKGGNEK